MKLKKIYLEKIRKEPDAFTKVLQAFNAGKGEVVTREALIAKLQRGGKSVTSHVALVDCLRQMGYSDEELFEN